MVLFPFCATFPAVAVRGKSKRIGEPFARELACLLKPLWCFRIGGFDRELAQHECGPGGTIMSILRLPIEQREPCITRLGKMFGALPVSECPFVVVGELGCELFRQCSRDLSA